MKRPVLVKGDKDQSISQKSSNGKKNDQHCKDYQLVVYTSVISAELCSSWYDLWFPSPVKFFIAMLLQRELVSEFYCCFINVFAITPNSYQINSSRLLCLFEFHITTTKLFSLINNKLYLFILKSKYTMDLHNWSRVKNSQSKTEEPCCPRHKRVRLSLLVLDLGIATSPGVDLRLKLY